MNPILKCFTLGAISFGMVYFLSKPALVDNNTLPPLGTFLSPKKGIWNNPLNDQLANTTQHFFAKKDSVKIHYDSNLIPHIFANNQRDLFYAQGFVTASMRLWQMEFQTHAAAGRISEIVGEKAIDFDRSARRRGMVYAAEQTIAKMEENPQMKMIVEAYSDGVNAYIESLSPQNYPVEYKLLNYAPEPWKPIKTALLLKYMAYDLCFGEQDLQNTNMLQLFGAETLDVLFPDMESAIDPIVENPGTWKKNEEAIDNTPTALHETVTHQLVGSPNPDNGSNNWAVGPDKSATGHAMLASDPHLGMKLPSLWFAVHLHAPGINVAGASLPGTPAVIIGFNEKIAWGVTNAQRDLVDWYKIQFKEGDKNFYKLDNQWTKTSPRIEEIKINGADSYKDTVYYTRFGPVMYDDQFHAVEGKKNYALKWIAHQGSNELYAFYLLNMASNHSDYMAALNHYSSPAQNFAFAAVDGDIAMRIQGKFPIKGKEAKFLRDGTQSKQDWNAYIPFDENIQYKNPERGFISSANQYPVDSTYSYFVHSRGFQNYRNRRINNVLRENDSISIQDMMDLQNDNYNLMAEESLPTFLRLLDSSTFNAFQKEAYKVLSTWDFYNEKESVAAAYYEAWMDDVMDLVWEEMDKEDVVLKQPSRFTTIRLIKEDPNFVFFDNTNSKDKVENAKDIVKKAFALSVSKVEVWKNENIRTLTWQHFKNTSISHLANIGPFGRENVAIGGNHDIVNATSEKHGPSWRMIVHLEDGNVQGYGIYPGGQSGNIASKYYDSMIGTWAKGDYIAIPLLTPEQLRN